MFICMLFMQLHTIVDHYSAEHHDEEQCLHCAFQASNDALPANDMPWKNQLSPTPASLDRMILAIDSPALIQASARAPPQPA